MLQKIFDVRGTVIPAREVKKIKSLKEKKKKVTIYFKTPLNF